MKKDKNFSHQTRGGHTQNSTTVDVSKQISTSNNYNLSAAAYRHLGTSPEQIKKDQRIRMPTRLQLALNQARADLQKNQQSAVQKGAKNSVEQSLNTKQNQGSLRTADVSKLLSVGKEAQILHELRERKYLDQHMHYSEMKSVNDLVYNEPTHLVSVFKDFLILDDVNEFLKRPYTHAEQKSRLSRLIQFYQKDLQASQIYPGCMDARDYPYANYASLLPDPGHYIFKNIERRQRLRDQRDYLKRKNMGETDENDENCSKNGDNVKEKKKEKEKASERMFDTQFMESVRLRHQNISLDDNQSFKFTSEVNETRKSIQGQDALNHQSNVINQSLVSINQYSSNAKHLKKNQRTDGAEHFKIPNRPSTRNIENLIQEFIWRDSIMISDGQEFNNSKQELLSFDFSQIQKKKQELRVSNDGKQFLRLNTEDQEALGKQYESMFENAAGSIDTEQSASLTQRSIRISAIMGDSVVPLPQSTVTNPFSTLQRKSDAMSVKNNVQQPVQSPLKSQRIANQRVPFIYEQDQSKGQRQSSATSGISAKSKNKRLKDQQQNFPANDIKQEIGPITVQIVQPVKQSNKDKNVKQITAHLPIKQSATATSKGSTSAETGSGAIAKKRKSIGTMPIKNETKSLNAVKSKNNLARQGVGAISNMGCKDLPKQMNLDNIYPNIYKKQEDSNRTPTVLSKNPQVMLLTNHSNKLSIANSKSPSGLGTMNVFKTKKDGTISKRNSTSIKANRDIIHPKFDTNNLNPNQQMKLNKIEDSNTDFKQETISKTKSFNSKNFQQFKGIDVHLQDQEEVRNMEDEENRSDDSDDTVKLEDFQEAQNNHYHQDIMQAVKNYSKVSVVNSTHQNMNSMITYHQHQNSQHSSIAQSIQLQTKASQQIVDNISQSIQSWNQQIPVHPGQTMQGRSSHHRNMGLVDMGSNSSEYNFDTRVFEQSSNHPFVRAVTSHQSGQMTRPSQYSHNKLQQSLNSISQHEIQIPQSIIKNGQAQFDKDINQIQDSNSFSQQKRHPGQDRQFQKEGQQNPTVKKQSMAQQIVIEQPEDMLVPSKTLNHQTTKLLMPRIASQPKLRQSQAGKYKSQDKNMFIDRYSTSQNGFDFFNKDMGGTNIQPHKKAVNLHKNDGSISRVSKVQNNKKSSNQNLLTLASPDNFVAGNQYFQNQSKFSNKLQTIASNQEESLNTQILNQHSFQNRSRTRPQSRNQGQKSVSRGSVGGSAAISNNKKMNPQSQPNHNHFESRKASMHRAQISDNTKQNINRFATKSQGQLQAARVIGPNPFSKSTIDPNCIGQKAQASKNHNLNQRRKSQNSKPNQDIHKGYINEMKNSNFEKNSIQMSLGSKSMQSLPKQQSLSRLKKSSHQQSPHIIKGLSSKQNSIYENQRIKQRQIISSHSKQITGSASMSTKSGPILISSIQQNQNLDFIVQAPLQPGSVNSMKQQINKKSPQESPIVDVQNKMHTRNKLRQTQSSIGTIKSLSAIPGSLAINEVATPVPQQSNVNQHHLIMNKKQFGNTQPLKNLQILSSNFQITQMTQGPSDGSNIFQEHQKLLDSHQKNSSISGSNQKSGLLTGNSNQLNRNLSPTLNFQMISRKDT